MNREKVIELAKEADVWVADQPPYQEQLERFAAFISEGNKQVLQQLLTLLGPTPPTCCGCAVEWQAAIDLIKGELE